MKRTTTIGKAGWIVSVVGVLVFQLYSALFTASGDSHIVFGWAMIALTFPLGLLPMFAYGFVTQVSGGAANDVLLWLLMASVGFFQWFWLIPRAFRWFKLRILST